MVTTVPRGFALVAKAYVRLMVIPTGAVPTDAVDTGWALDQAVARVNASDPWGNDITEARFCMLVDARCESVQMQVWG